MRYLPERRNPKTLAFPLLALVLAALPLGAPAQQGLALRIEASGEDEAEAARVFERLDPAEMPEPLLVDQVATLVDPTAFNGSAAAPPASLNAWRQLYHQLSRSGTGTRATPHPRGGRRVDGLPSIDTVNEMALSHLAEGVVPLAVLNVPFSRIAPDALDAELLELRDGRLEQGPVRSRSPYERHRAFAVAAFETETNGRTVRFVVPDDLIFSARGPRLARFTIDFGDGAGSRSVRPNEVVAVEYAEGGEKTVVLTAEQGGTTLTASTTLMASAASIPTPDLEWSNQAASVPYAGAVAKYDAIFFFGAGNTAPTRPVVFVEGFDPYFDDPANRRTWEDIYEILLKQDFVTRLRALGYDAVIMKLHNATDYVQRNAYALEHLLGRIKATIPANERTIVVGPSMGGLIGRYALARMERAGIAHNVRLFASLDSPQQAANFPLGIQFFLEFNDGDSELAALGKKAVNSVAARQMLAYQYQTFPSADPLRTQLLKELDDYGYPETRNIAIANGSGSAVAQLGNELVGYREMVPGDKIIEYRYRSWYVDLDGDVWALPDRTPETQIFEGLKDVIGPHYRSLNVYVSGTLPYDNTPGGSRSTQSEIADSPAPYGDIRTSFPDHSWIPTVSALDLGTENLSYNVLADPEALTTVPVAGKRASRRFDAVYFPAENQPHVFATEDNVRFLLDEIDTYFRPGRVVAEKRTFNSGQRIVVADGTTVTFEGPVHVAPGVRFVLGRNAGILFKGAVSSLGTSVEPVVFERSGASRWGHVDLIADGNRFENTVFDGGNKTVEVRSRDNTFRDCVFRNGVRGVSSYYTIAGTRSSFRLERSIVEDNTSVGVVAYHADPAFEYVTIRDNGQSGLWAYDATSSLFYRSLVTNNALTQAGRGGIEVLGGASLKFYGRDLRGGYSRISGNASHELYATSSAGNVILGLYTYGGYNALFDANEGADASTEMLVRNQSSRALYAHRTYWGGFAPDADDIIGTVYVATILYTDPTTGSGAAVAPLIASRVGTLDAAESALQAESDDVRLRMAEIRRELRSGSVGPESAGLLRELMLLQNLDTERFADERPDNLALLAGWRSRLTERGATATHRKRPSPDELKAAEAAALLEIRDALQWGEYERAATLLDGAEPHLIDRDSRKALQLERITSLEQQGRYAEALSALSEVRAARDPGEPPGLYDPLAEMLSDRLRAEPEGQVQRAAAMPTAAARVASASARASASEETGLGEAFPNPFNPTTLVPYTLERPASVLIDVFDMLGRRVAVLADGRFEAGAHRATFEAAVLPSGVYVVRARLEIDGEPPRTFVRKVTLMR